MVVDLGRDQLNGEFHSLLLEPDDVPEVTVLDSPLAECQGYHLVCKDLLPTLGLKDET